MDYGHPSLLTDDFVLVRVGNLYIQCNSAKGYNLDTPMPFRNRVVIAEANGNLEISTHLGRLGTGQQFIYPDFHGSADLIIHVCEQVRGVLDYALISIYLSDGVQSTTCEQSPNGGQFRGNGTEDEDVNSWRRDGGPLIREEEGPTSHGASAGDAALTGAIWGVVGVLVVVACILVYRFRKQKQEERAEQAPKRGVVECETRDSDVSSVSSDGG